MKTMMAFIKNHPVLAFFALAFAISWGGILLIAGGSSGIPATPEQAERLLPVVMLAWFAGPSVGSILLTGLVSGQAGYRELFARLLRWRVGPRWYAIALLTAPLLYGAISLYSAPRCGSPLQRSPQHTVDSSRGNCPRGGWLETDVAILD